MRCLFSLAAVVMLALAGLAPAQSPADPNGGSRFDLDPATGTYTFSWWGVAGRTYFLQQSSDLLNWTYLQDIESGADQPIQVSILSAAPRLFLRLRYTDVPTSDPLNDDFDGGGVSNWDELLQGTDPLVANLDSNGLPYDWERFYGIPFGTDPDAPAPRGDGLTYRQAFQQGVNPLDFYNGQAPVLAKVSGDGQTGNPGGFVPAPLVVSVADASGNPLANAPVTFSVLTGGGQVQRSSSSLSGYSVTALTDASGQARAFFQLLNTKNTQSTVKAVGANSVQPAPALFTESTDDGTGSFGSPFAPSSVVGQRNPDGSEDLTWVNNTDDATPVTICEEQADGSWTPFLSLPAGTTSCHLPAR